MPAPSLGDYHEALQMPRIAFREPGLKVCAVECNASGPKPRTGNFAAVFKVESAGTSYAVRCFTREIPTDLRDRYAAISAHLQKAKIPAMVPFEFQDQGILIAGHWHPIVKMAWQSGESLYEYIRKNVRNQSKMRSLISDWVTLIRSLRDGQIAHGDLQTGNVLVVGGALRLIDYDGMFVPALAGKKRNELGQDNFQHPRRSADVFDLSIDNFSAWSIFVTLSALSIDPGLWDKFGGEPERLLFRKADYDNPVASPIFSYLRQSTDARLKMVSSIFLTFLSAPAEVVPSLDEQTAGVAVSSSPGPSVSRAISGGASWILDHQRSVSKPPQIPTVAPTQSGLPLARWIIDSLTSPQPVPPKSFQNAPGKERYTSLAITALCLAFAVAGWNGILAWWIPLAAATGMCAAYYRWILSRFRSDPSIKAMADCQQVFATTERNTATSEAVMKDVESKQQAESNKWNESLATIHKAFVTRSEALSAELAAIDRKAQQELAVILEREQRVSVETATRSMTLQAEFTGKSQPLTTAISTAGPQRDMEIQNELLGIQKQFVRDTLQSRFIASASFDGIGDGLKQRLEDAGIRTAADISDQRIRQVHGFQKSVARVATLLAWRSMIETNAHNRKPSALLPARRQAIEAKWAAIKDAAEKQHYSLKSRYDADCRTLEVAKSKAQEECRILKEVVQQERTKLTSDATRRSQGELERLRAEMQKVAADGQKAMERFSQPIQAARKDYMAAHAALQRGRRELDAFNGLTFKAYVTRLVARRQEQAVAAAPSP